VAKKKKKRRVRLRWGRIFFAIFSIILLAVGITIGSLYYYVEHRVNNDSSDYIVVMGIDAREHWTEVEGERADTLMLVKVDYKSKTVDLLSLPRDSYVKIPCEDNEYDKITHSYFYGGKKCAIESVKNTFEVEEIDNHMVVDFAKLIKLVDEMGGIDLTPSKTFCEKGADDSGEYCFTAGISMHLDGEYALAYARHRKSDSDIYRTQRQQEVLNAIIDKAKTLNVLDAYNFTKKVLDEVDTDITLEDALIYFKLALDEDFKVNKHKIEGEDYYNYYGTYYYKLDEEWLEKIIELIKE